MIRDVFPTEESHSYTLSTMDLPIQEAITQSAGNIAELPTKQVEELQSSLCMAREASLNLQKSLKSLLLKLGIAEGEVETPFDNQQAVARIEVCIYVCGYDVPTLYV